MTDNEDKRKRIIDRFKRHVATAGSGIFTRSTREKLLGTKRMWGGRGQEGGRDEKVMKRTVNTFWYRTRNQVRTALTDLQFFIESADKSNVNQVVTAETLSPIVYGLLDLPIKQKKIPDRVRSEIARLFIEAGFRYLSGTNVDYMTLSHKRTLGEALDLATLLAVHPKRVERIES